jgi:hypothetical protein
MGLSLAVELLIAFYEKEHKLAVSAEVAARALGHAGVSESGRLSGPALAKLAALRQYGLIENVSKGKVRISDLGLDFTLHTSAEPEFLNAARVAALTPPLFSELYPEYVRASGNAFRAHLIKERRFSEDGAGRVIKAFRDTISFAKLDDGSYTPSHEVEIAAKPPAHAGTLEQFDRILVTGPKWNKLPTKEPLNTEGRSTAMPLTYILPGGVNAQLSFAGGDPTKRAVQRLIDYLKMLKDDLPDAEAARGANPAINRDEPLE